jgi:small subunit ribosomal protein S1
LDRNKQRIVLSEKAVSEKDQIALHEKAQEEVKEGEFYEGIIKQVTNFGIFVEIEVKVNKKSVRVEGLVHVSEMSWEKTSDPLKNFNVGDKVKVRSIKSKDGKLSFSIKQAKEDPWEKIEQKYPIEKQFSGRVVRNSSFGTFVELESGVEGLVHVTKIPPGTDLTPGKTVECYVEEVNREERRISLGLVLTSKPVGYK